MPDETITRTTLTLPLVRLFAWNMPYDAEHHAYPAVPFHALPRLHERVRGRIANLESGYLAATVKVNRYLFGPEDMTEACLRPAPSETATTERPTAT